jgi:pimeloyl-ACP methyl ester carboxylesterase
VVPFKKKKNYVTTSPSTLHPKTFDPSPMSQPKRRFIRVSRLLGKWSISRLLRWVVVLAIAGWVAANWHDDLPTDTLEKKYTFGDSWWVEVDGQRIHCRTTGKGAPLVLLHDEGSSLHTWQRWTDSLALHFQVISVDLPGFGLSGPHPRGSYSTFMYANFLTQLADTLRLKKMHLAGVGLGGQIAWFFAAEHPERVDHLILLDAPGFEGKETSWVTLLAQTPVVNRAMWTVTPRAFFKILLQEIYADDALVSDSLIGRHFDLMRRAGNRKAFTDRAPVLDNSPPTDFVERITAPTLVLWGAEDSRISPQHAYDFHRRIRGALLKIYQNTGHWPQEENPAESAADVRAFLENRF